MRKEVLMREYDQTLVSMIQDKTRTELVDGEEIIFKPVPDDGRANVVDPRVVETTKIKMQVKSLDRNSKFSLYSNRVRPDKISHDITSTDVREDEDLVHINNDHYIDVYTFTPENFEPGRPVLIYLHGGGYMTGDVAEFRMAMRFVAEQSGCRVIFPEYRLSPENPFPAGIEDCHAIVEWVYENADKLEVDRNRIMVGGDSAGGGLTNSCLYLDRDLHHIDYAYEYYAAFDSDFDKYEQLYSDDLYPVIAEHEVYARNRINRIRFSGGTGDLYLQGKTEKSNPLVSIMEVEDLSWLPAMTVVCGEYDFLRLPSDMFVKKARSAGVPVRSLRYLGCDHGFMEKVGVLPQAEEVLLDMADTLKNL